MPSLRINVPPLTRGLLVTLLVLSVANTYFRLRYLGLLRAWNLPGVSFMTIIPTRSFKFPWTIATAALIEQNLVSLAASGLTLFYGGRYLERAWGSAEYAKFVLFVTLIPNVLAFTTYLIWYLLGGNKDRGNTMIHGGIAFEAAFLVAFKQLVPEHTVSIKNIIKMRVKHFPAVFVLLNSLSGPILGTDTAFFLSWYGFMTSWVYLRFYRAAPSMIASETGEGPVIKGDASDTFAFSHFFPDAIQAAIAPLCDQIYNTLVALKLCTPFSTEAIESGNEQASARAEGGLPGLMGSGRGAGRSGGRREEAERRRALALKALDQRLNAAAQGQSAGPPPGQPAASSAASGAPPVTKAENDVAVS